MISLALWSEGTLAFFSACHEIRGLETMVSQMNANVWSSGGKNMFPKVIYKVLMIHQGINLMKAPLMLFGFLICCKDVRGSESIF